MIKAHKDWKKVLTKSWSVRFMVLAAILSGLEVALPYLPLNIHPGIFGVLVLFTSAGAFAARLIAQKEFVDDK